MQVSSSRSPSLRERDLATSSEHLFRFRIRRRRRSMSPAWFTVAIQVCPRHYGISDPTPGQFLTVDAMRRELAGEGNYADMRSELERFGRAALTDPKDLSSCLSRCPVENSCSTSRCVGRVFLYPGVLPDPSCFSRLRSGQTPHKKAAACPLPSLGIRHRQ